MMQDLVMLVLLHHDGQFSHVLAYRWNTYSKPMWECTTRRAQRIESVTGFSEPAAKGAMVKGTRPAETIL
jgi:hypothetical protein